MSYVLTIRRDAPLRADELRALVQRDESLSILPDEETEVGAILWNGENPPLPLTFDNGGIWSTPRNDAAIIKMQELARSLNARLIGEDGEDLTEEDFAAKAPLGCGGKVAIIVLAFGAGGVLQSLVHALLFG